MVPILCSLATVAARRRKIPNKELQCPLNFTCPSMANDLWYKARRWTPPVILPMPVYCECIYSLCPRGCKTRVEPLYLFVIWWCKPIHWIRAHKPFNSANTEVSICQSSSSTCTITTEIVCKLISVSGYPFRLVPDVVTDTCLKHPQSLNLYVWLSTTHLQNAHYILIVSEPTYPQVTELGVLWILAPSPQH